MGGTGSRKNEIDLNYEPIGMIAIVYDVEFEYVCNIYLNSATGETVSLASGATGCELDLDAIDNVDNAFILFS